MTTFPLQALYVSKPKSEVELQADIESPAHKAGKEKGVALLWATEAYLKWEDTEQALRSVREALSIFREQKSDDLEAPALCLLAKARTGGAFNLEALQAANRALKLFKEIGEPTGQAAALYVAAQVHAATPNPDDAAWKAAEARKAFKQLGDKTGEAAALEVMAKCHFTQQDFKKGLPAAQDAAAAFRELGETSKEAASLCILAKMHLGLGELDMALQVAKDAMSKYQELGEAAGESLDVAVSAYMKMGSKDDAVFAAQQEAAQLRQRGDSKEEAGVLYRIAELLLQCKAPEQAAGPSAEAEKIFRSVGHKPGEIKALTLGARIKLEQMEKAEALILAEAAVTLGWGADAIDEHCAALECVADIHARNRDFPKAFNAASEAMNAFQGTGEKKGQAAMLLVQADIQMLARYANEALESMKNAPGLFQEAGAKKEEAAALAKLAQAYLWRNEASLALKAAEASLAIYKKLCDTAGKAEAAKLIAAAHFGLAGRGNAREALRAAHDALTIHQAAGDRAAEAGALTVLANAQLMNQSFGEAQRTARAAEAIFQELGDVDGQAGALLLVAGAHLGSGEFAESRDVAKDARALFQDVGNGKAEDGVEDFLDALKQYEGGALNRADFMGFTLGVPDPAAQQATRKRDKERKRDTAILSNVDMYLPGPKGEKMTVTFFDAFEARRATAPTRGPAARRASEAAAAAAEGQGELARPAAEGVTFAVRLMPKYIVGEEVPEKRPPPEDIEDKRLHFAVHLGQPNQKFPGNCGKTNRMFSAMGQYTSVL